MRITPIQLRSILVALPIAAGLSAALVRCSDDANETSKPPGNDGGTNNNDAGTGRAQVRFVHASPNAPAVSVWAAGNTTPLARGGTDGAQDGLGYGEATGYVAVDAGTYTVQLKTADASADSAAAAEVANVSLQAGKKYTAVAFGAFGESSDAAKKFTVGLYEEAFQPAADGRIRVRIVHGAPGAPAVKLEVGDDDRDSEAFALIPASAGLAYGQETGSDGLDLDAAGGQLALYAPDADDADQFNRLTAFTLPALPRGEYFVVAAGNVTAPPTDGPTSKPFALIAVPPTGNAVVIRQNPIVYTLHASPIEAAVDVCAETGTSGDGGAPEEVALVHDPADPGFVFGELRNVQVPPSAAGYTVKVRLRAEMPCSGELVEGSATTTPALSAGDRVLVVATGIPEDDDTPFNLRLYRDEFAPIDPSDTKQLRLRVIHASPGAPAVDLGLVSDAQTGADFTKFEANSGLLDLRYSSVDRSASPGSGFALPAQAINLGFVQAGLNPEVAALAAQLTPPGTQDVRAFAVAAGRFSGGNSQNRFRLFLINTSTVPWSDPVVVTVNDLRD